MNALAAMQHYKQVRVHSGIMDASPHRLIQMLMEGALERIAQAKGAMLNKNISAKGEYIGKAIGIIGGLQSSLNKDAGGEVAENLGNLYDYMVRRLMEANIGNDVGMLDEVAGLMTEIKAGWDNMPESYKY